MYLVKLVRIVFQNLDLKSELPQITPLPIIGSGVICVTHYASVFAGFSVLKIGVTVRSV